MIRVRLPDAEALEQVTRTILWQMMSEDEAMKMHFVLRLVLPATLPDKVVQHLIGPVRSWTMETEARELRREYEILTARCADLTPDVIVDPLFCRINGLRKQHGVYLAHRPWTPLIMAYGEKRLRDQAVRDLVRRASSLDIPLPPEGQSPCSICYEAKRNVCLSVCGHDFCAECLTRTLLMYAESGRGFACPECGEAVAWDTVRSFLGPDHAKQWLSRQVAQAARRHPEMVPACPHCRAVPAVRPKKEFRCTSCHETTCWPCSKRIGEPTPIHRGPCRTGADQHASLQRVRENIGGLNVYPCPTCYTPIEKLSGCPHMTCTVPDCNTHFCWGCLQQFSNNGRAGTCNGTVDEIDKDVIWVTVDAATWTTPDLCPPPERLCLKRSVAPSGVTVGTALRDAIWMYMYDHHNQCGQPVNKHV